MQKVSVIVPAYKYTEEQLGRTLRSLLLQSDQDFETVFSLEGKNNLEVDWQGLQSDNVKVINSVGVYGPSVARNIGVAASSGNIITYMDMGDEIAPERVNHLKQIFENMPEMNIVLSSYTMVHPSAGESVYDAHEKVKRTFTDTKNKTAGVLFQHAGLCPPLAVAHKRKPFMVLGGFQPKILSGEEGVLWRRFSDKLDPDTVAFTDFNAGKKYFQEYDEKDFDGFEIDTKLGATGQYLDEQWFKEYV